MNPGVGSLLTRVATKTMRGYAHVAVVLRIPCGRCWRPIRMHHWAEDGVWCRLELHVLLRLWTSAQLVASTPFVVSPPAQGLADVAPAKAAHCQSYVRPTTGGPTNV